MVTTTQKRGPNTSKTDPKIQKPSKVNAKEERLSQLLQRNLLRRKQQQC